MIALLLGMLLLAAFLEVLQRSRTELLANESLARLQDGARHALSVLVPDLEHAGFYGFAATTGAQLARAGNVTAGPGELRQPIDRPLPAVAGLPAGLHDCGVNFAVDLGLPVQAANGAFPPGIGPVDCEPAASAGGVRAATDSLTVRRASLAATAPHAGRLQIFSRRLDSHAVPTLFADGRAPGPRDDQGEVRDVEVRTYYIANHSVGRAGWPALRVKALTEAGGEAQFRDEEIQPGVEDLQIEIGVAGNDVDTPPRFVAPDAPEARRLRVVAVRLWLRIRADVTEHGYSDARPLTYSDVSYTPDPVEAAQRRILVERTVTLRNPRRHPP